MDVLQYEVRGSRKQGFYVAAYDEASKRFVRLSKEAFKRFIDASNALFSGTWTIA